MLVAVTLALLVAAPEVERLVVVPVILQKANPDRAMFSSIHREVSRAAVARIGLRVLAEEETFTLSRDGLSRSIEQCGSDDPCVVAALKAAGIRIGMLAVVNLVVEPPFVAVKLYDTTAGHLAVQSGGALDPMLERDVAGAIYGRAAAALDQLGFKRAGKLSVRLEPGTAALEVDPPLDPERGSAYVFIAPPGRYRLTARLDGYASQTRMAESIVDQETNVVIALDSETTLVDSPWFWGAIGAIVIGGVTAAILASLPDKMVGICVMDADTQCEN